MLSALGSFWIDYGRVRSKYNVCTVGIISNRLCTYVGRHSGGSDRTKDGSDGTIYIQQSKSKWTFRLQCAQGIITFWSEIPALACVLHTAYLLDSCSSPIFTAITGPPNNKRLGSYHNLPLRYCTVRSIRFSEPYVHQFADGWSFSSHSSSLYVCIYVRRCSVRSVAYCAVCDSKSRPHHDGPHIRQRTNH